MKTKLILALALLGFTAPAFVPAFTNSPTALVAMADEGAEAPAPAPEAPVAEPAPEAPAPEVPEYEPSESELQLLVKSLGGALGGGILAIAYFIAQVFMLLLKGKLGAKFTGAWQITVVSFMTLVLGVLGLMVVGGLEFGAAIVHSTTLAAFSVFANQLFQQIIKKKA
jgi:hypothetical protein